MVRRPAAALALALALLGAVAPSRSASAGAARPAYLTTPAAVLTAAGPGALSGAERAAAFQRFVDDGAMTLDGVEIRAHAGGDGAAGGAQLGVFASRDLAEGEAYLSVPWDHVLGMHTAMDHPVSTVTERQRAHRRRSHSARTHAGAHARAIAAGRTTRKKRRAPAACLPAAPNNRESCRARTLIGRSTPHLVSPRPRSLPPSPC